MDIPFVLMGLLAGAGLLIPSLDVALRGRMQASVARYVAFAALLVAVGLVVGEAVTAGSVGFTAAAGVFRNDALGLFFSMVVLLVSILVVGASFDYMRGDPNESVFYALLLFTALGMVLLAFAVDLLMIFVAWELMSLPTYVLAGFHKRSPLSNEAAVKYFVLGALSSGILLYAISVMYGITGTTNLEEVVRVFAEPLGPLAPLSVLALTLFIAGFGLKLAAVPFHMWIPDTYQGAPPVVSTLLAAGTKKAGFVAAIRVFAVALVLFRVDWTTAFAVLAVLTMTVGNVAALMQRSMTRLLAYSSIAQAGYIMIGLAVAPASELGLVGVMFHTLTHAIMKSTAFIAVVAVGYRTLKYDLDSYNGLGRRMPYTALSLAVALLALTGVPPLNGFWSKLVLFTAAIDGQMAWLAVAGVLNSAFSLGYYAWIIKRMYMDEPRDIAPIGEPRTFVAVLIAATILIIATGVYPTPIFDFAQRAVLQLGG